MRSLNQIRKTNQELAEKMAQKNKKPYVVYNAEEVDTYPPFPFPNFGDYRPEGWGLEEDFFVDKSGLGKRKELALTVEQFKGKVKKQIKKDGTWGFAIISEGEFQVYVGAFKLEDDAE